MALFNWKNQNKGADLQFDDGSEVSGFTPAGVAGFSDLNPAAVVREIMQNSQDAVKESGQKQTHIRFEIAKHRLRDIPGIMSYRRAFDYAVRDQTKKQDGSLSDQADEVVKVIRGCLGQEQCTTLFVLDNGIGLDNNRMEAILADGLSIKTSTSTGAVGNGHFVVIPASDLRYVLYAGRTIDGTVIGSGHAILASHQTNGKLKSKDGFYVKGFNSDLFNPHQFPENEEVPDYISEKLNWITEHWGSTGTVLAVPGFNYLRETGDSLRDVITHAASGSFFASFERGEIEVEVVDESGHVFVLDGTNIQSMLEKFSVEKRRTRRNRFLTGSRAHMAYSTMKNGQDATVLTDIGKVDLKLRKLTDGGKTRIDLCRNGMWVSDDLHGKLRDSQFTGLMPFHCVLLLNHDSGEIARIIRKSEGPLHCEVNVKKLQGPDRRKLNAAFDDIAAKIRELVPEQASDQFKVHDVMSITSHGISSGGRRSATIGSYKDIQRKTTEVSSNGNSEAEDGSGLVIPKQEGKGKGIGPRRGGRGKFRRSGNALQFRALSVPVGPRSCRIDIEPDEKATAGEVRFTLDESLDESCDDIGTEEFVKIENVRLNGELVSDDALTRDSDNNAMGVRIENLNPGIGIRIEVDYILPTGVVIPEDTPVVIKTDLVRRAAQ